jgi:hypothetical protein
MKVVYATTNTTVTREGGVGITIHAGQHWPANDPVVKDYPDLFSDDPRNGLRVSAPLAEDAPVEQATAAPGEKRTTRKRAQGDKGDKGA